MYISNGKNNVTYISNKPSREDMEKYYNTTNLDLLLGECFEIQGIDATIEYLQHKLKYYKALKKEEKKEDEKKGAKKEDE